MGKKLFINLLIRCLSFCGLNVSFCYKTHQIYGTPHYGGGLQKETGRARQSERAIRSSADHASAQFGSTAASARRSQLTRQISDATPMPYREKNSSSSSSSRIRNYKF